MEIKIMQIDIKDLEKVKIEPDEFLLIKFIGDMDMASCNETYRAIKNYLPEGIKILAYREDMMNLQVVKQL